MQTVIIPCRQPENWTPGVETERSRKLMARFQKISDSLNPDMSVTGAVLEFPIADGKAYYRIINETPLIFEHLPFGKAYALDPKVLAGFGIEYVKKTLKQKKGIAAWKRICKQ